MKTFSKDAWTDVDSQVFPDYKIALCCYFPAVTDSWLSRLQAKNAHKTATNL